MEKQKRKKKWIIKKTKKENKK